jgi:hypothetical protein
MLKNRHIAYLARYADDIFIIFDATYTLAERIDEHNAMYKQLKYKLEIENNQLINFLDLSVYRTMNGFNFGTYRKPTYADTVIPKSSNHPNRQKQAAFNFLLDKAYNLPITALNRQYEIDLIDRIAVNNGYNFSEVMNTYVKGKKQKLLVNIVTPIEAKDNTKIWAKFTYFGEDIRTSPRH